MDVATNTIMMIAVIGVVLGLIGRTILDRRFKRALHNVEMPRELRCLLDKNLGQRKEIKELKEKVDEALQEANRKEGFSEASSRPEPL